MAVEDQNLKRRKSTAFLEINDPQQQQQHHQLNGNTPGSSLLSSGTAALATTSALNPSPSLSVRTTSSTAHVKATLPSPSTTPFNSSNVQSNRICNPFIRIVQSLVYILYQSLSYAKVLYTKFFNRSILRLCTLVLYILIFVLAIYMFTYKFSSHIPSYYKLVSNANNQDSNHNNTQKLIQELIVSFERSANDELKSAFRDPRNVYLRVNRPHSISLHSKHRWQYLLPHDHLELGPLRHGTNQTSGLRKFPRNSHTFASGPLFGAKLFMPFLDFAASKWYPGSSPPPVRSEQVPLFVNKDGTPFQNGYKYAYFRGELQGIDTYDEAIGRLYVSLMTAFSEWADSQNLPYWLTDETLLGWYWNKQRLPWSRSLTVGVSSRGLFIASEVASNFMFFKSRYKVIMHPDWKDRRPSQFGSSDARFVDIKTGLYVNIAGLVAVASPRPGKSDANVLDVSFCSYLPISFCFYIYKF